MDGRNGFQLSGERENAGSGRAISSAGDVNSDGFNDVIVGAPDAGPQAPYSGVSSVIFGKAGGFAAEIELSALNGRNGFQLSGEVERDPPRRVSGVGWRH